MHIRSILGLVAVFSLLAACTALSVNAQDSVTRGQVIFTKECAQCHGSGGEGAGPASLGIGTPAPDLIGLSQRNDGHFPREFVRRFVLGQLETDDPEAAMPDFASVGLQHVYPDGGAGRQALVSDFDDLLDYLNSIQE